jgi:hypothetical protein
MERSKGVGYVSFFRSIVLSVDVHIGLHLAIYLFFVVRFMFSLFTTAIIVD